MTIVAGLGVAVPPDVACKLEELRVRYSEMRRPDLYEAEIARLREKLRPLAAPSRIERMVAESEMMNLRDFAVLIEHAASDGERKLYHEAAGRIQRHLEEIRTGYTTRTGLPVPAELADGAVPRSKYLGTTPDTAQRLKIVEGIVERSRDCANWAHAYVRRDARRRVRA